MKTMKIKPETLLITLIFFACNPAKESKEEQDSYSFAAIEEREVPKIKVNVVQQDDFSYELESNGKLAAHQKVDLNFRVTEAISKIRKQNGDRVRKGELIATLEDFEYKLQYQQSQNQYDNAVLELADFLIGQGYDIADSAAIPAQTLQLAKLRSGFPQAKRDLSLAKYNYEQTRLYAPISGIMANLFSSELNFPLNEGPFCTLINHDYFYVDFPIMESELGLVRPGQAVEVTPYYEEGLQEAGHIKYINPVVDENGLVSVRAMISNLSGRLFEGMNVKIYVKDVLVEKLTIPKTAVTMRSNKPVVFTYQNGLAHWNYVELGEENSQMAVIRDGLQEGDTVIVEGNLHLAHLSKVTLDPPVILLTTNNAQP